MVKKFFLSMFFIVSSFDNAASNMRDNSDLRSVVIGDSSRLILPGSQSRSYGSTTVATNRNGQEERSCSYYFCSCDCCAFVTATLVVAGTVAFFMLPPQP